MASQLPLPLHLVNVAVFLPVSGRSSLPPWLWVSLIQARTRRTENKIRKTSVLALVCSFCNYSSSFSLSWTGISAASGVVGSSMVSVQGGVKVGFLL